MAGRQAFIARIADLIAEGIGRDRCTRHRAHEPERTARTLYQMWLGDSLLDQPERDRSALEAAMDVTRQVLAAL